MTLGVPAVLLAAALSAPVTERSLLSDLGDDVLTAVGSRRSAAPAELLAAVLRAARPFEFSSRGITLLTDRRWFRVDSVEGPGAPALEVRRWPGDSIVAFYDVPAEVGPAALLPGLEAAGSAGEAGPCSVRDGRLVYGGRSRAVLWAECAKEARRVVALGLPGDAGLGAAASTDLREEILALLRQTRIGESGGAPEASVRPPELPIPPGAADERKNAWQVLRADGFTLGLPPGIRAITIDPGSPPPRPMPGALVWLRGRFVDRDGEAIAVGDGRRVGYVARADPSDEGWRAGVAPPLLAPSAERSDAAELHDLVLDWTGATRAVVSHWREEGFAGDWLVFRLHMRGGGGIEIGLPVLSGWRSLALFWIPVTWRREDRPPAPPPIDPAAGLGVRFDRLRSGERARQALIEGTLTAGSLKLELPRGFYPVANMGAPDGFPVTILDSGGAVAGKIEPLTPAAVEAAIASGGFSPLPRPGTRKAAAIHLRGDGACVLVSRAGGGYLLAPEAGGRDRAEAWRRLLDSAAFVKAARREESPRPGRDD